jgi:hypothetical protein
VFIPGFLTSCKAFTMRRLLHISAAVETGSFYVATGRDTFVKVDFEAASPPIPIERPE